MRQLSHPDRANWGCVYARLRRDVSDHAAVRADALAVDPAARAGEERDDLMKTAYLT